MSEIIRFSLCKSKVIHYIFGILLACFVVPICSAQPPQKNNVNDFISSTWNTNGPRWHVVQTLMNSGLDVLAIQEAGSIASIENQLRSPSSSIPICFGGVDIQEDSDVNTGFRESVWTFGGQNFYMYYYDNRSEVPNRPGVRQGVTKQNLAIISRQRADEVIIIPNEVAGLPDNYDTQPYNRREERIRTNRPVLGIRIANSVFFNMHPEPLRDTRPNSNTVRNESATLISIIENYMWENYRTHTWMVMGDFNATPDQFRPNLPAPANSSRVVNILHTGVNTRVSGELDYAVVGGPRVYQAAINAIVAALITIAHTSDHEPVIFKTS